MDCYFVEFWITSKPFGPKDKKGTDLVKCNVNNSVSSCGLSH